MQRQLAQDLGAEHHLARHDRLHCRNHGGDVLFDQIALGMQVDGTADIVGVGECGEDQDARIGVVLQDALRRLKAVDAWHLHVDEQHVGGVPAAVRHGGLAVMRAPQHLRGAGRRI